MDLAGPAASGCSLIGICLLLTCLAFSQAAAVDQQAKQLLDQQKWQDVVALAESTPSRSADLDFCYGSALAQLQRWPDAHRAFRAGAALQPRDPRFPIELAGVDFKQKRYADAASHLRRALHLSPDDSYANDFLATIYFLQGNLEGAVKYWNRTGKPHIIAVNLDPKPRVNPALLDRAFAFAPASTLRLSDLRTSQARVDALEIFPSSNFELQARPDGQFDLVFHNHENNGFGSDPVGALVTMFRGLPALTVHPVFFNFRHQAIDLGSTYRWDAEKRRVLADISLPWRHGAKRRFTFGADLRGENWDIRPSFTGTVPLLGSFNMRREAVKAEISTVQSWRWNWVAGVEASQRDFRDVNLGTALTPELLPRGYQLKQTAAFNVQVLRIPEDRLTLTSNVLSQAGRIWSQPTHAFEKLQGALNLHWLPQAVGDDYEVQHSLRAGKTWGTVPFDELFMLGGLGDNTLVMRGHIVTHGGRKGSGPLGRNYFLSNSEVDKNIFHDAWVAVKLGPFLDVGKITDPLPGLGSHQWLWDIGGQVKVKGFGVGVALSYGKDLRSGNNAVMLTFLEK